MKTYQVLLAGILSIGLLASCASDERNEPSPSKGTTTTLRISLNGAGTRATYLTTDPETSAATAVNTAIIAIEDKDGNIKSIQEPTVKSGVATLTVNSIDATNDKVVVAANVPSSITSFSGITSIGAFNTTLTDDIDDALAGSSSGTSEINSNLPMYGVGSITANGDGTGYTASPNVYHLVAKISLAALSVNFSTTGAFSGASFKPNEVFLCNVPDKLCYCSDTPWPSSVGAWYQGESTKTGTGDYYKEYLGTGKTHFNSVSALSGTQSLSSVIPIYFYTMPNKTSNDTRLVIEGTFKANASDAGTEVYYPVSINHKSDGTTAGTGAVEKTDKYVYPNSYYALHVTIQGKGVSSPTGSVDPEALSVTVTVKDFTPAQEQDNTFN